MVQRRRVALLIDTATSWGSGLIAGIAEYAHRVADWQLFLGPRGKYDRLTLPSYWAGDGIIARVTHDRLAQQIIRRNLPAVNVSWYRYGGDAIPQCTCDEQSVGDMAVRYFLDRGFRQFAYCSSSLRNDYVDRLGASFIAGLKQRTYPCHVFQPVADPDGFLPTPAEVDRLVQWLRNLPKPIALLAFDSVQARQITDVCHIANINVPHEVAVLGGEHDMLSCTISQPQLSSIDHSPEKVGWAAAQLLDQLMQGASPPHPVLLPASRVITRQSTDTVAVPDDLLASAVEFIKANAARRIQVRDILAAVPISRRALEKGFRKLLGRSPAEEIRRVRLDMAVQLLCDTSWPMPRIASLCGFERPELLTRAFRRELKITPTEFRRRHARQWDDARPADRTSAESSAPSRRS